MRLSRDLPAGRGAGFSFLLAILMLAVLLTGCAGGGQPTFAPGERQMLWQDSDGFAALGPIETSGAPDNDHPVSFSPARIERALAALDAREGSGGLFSLGDARVRPVFSLEMIDRLAEPIARGMNRAGPRQDVIFSISGFRGFSFTDDIGETVMVSGRVFHRDGRLNVIIGQLNESVKTIASRQSSGNPKATPSAKVKEVIRKRSAQPGTRADSLASGWALLDEQGIALASAREDWAVIDPDGLAPLPQDVVDKLGRDLAPDADDGERRRANATDGARRQEGATTPERRQTRRSQTGAEPAQPQQPERTERRQTQPQATPEPATERRQAQPGTAPQPAPQQPVTREPARQAPAQAPRQAAPRQVAPAPAVLPTRAPTEAERKALKARLEELRDLRDEGLIPEDIYRDKAREILEAL